MSQAGNIQPANGQSEKSRGGNVLVRGGRLIDPAAGLDAELDVRIVDGAVTELGSDLQPNEGETVVDAAGCWVTPGWIDVHVHLRDPGFEYKETIETGSRSAVAGGFTTLVAMANTKPVNDDPAVTRYMLDRAKEVGLCRVLPVGAATKNLAGEQLAEIGQMVKAGAVMISDDGMPVMSAAVQRKVFEYCKALEVPVSIHAEDLHLSEGGCCNEGEFSAKAGLRGVSVVAEDVMIVRDIVLSKLTGAHLHVAHISTAGGVEAVRQAKAQGIPVTAEVTPHHFALTDEELLRYDGDFKMNPPLRSAADRDAVIAALADGTIDVVATDHAPHAESEKAVEFSEAPNGVVGLETALPLLLELVASGRVPLTRAIESVTSAAAKLIRRSDLGTLTPGSSGDVTIIEPQTEWVVRREDLRSKSKNTPFHGRTVRGRVRTTLFQGRVVFQA